MMKDYQQTQIYRLDLQTYNWDQVQTRSEDDNASIPNQIDEHSAEIDGSRVVIFGGFLDGERTNTIRTFDLNTHVWSVVEPVNAGPKPRAGHTATFHEDNLYVFGGKDDENKKLNDMWKYSFILRKWT